MDGTDVTSEGVLHAVSYDWGWFMQAIYGNLGDGNLVRFTTLNHDLKSPNMGGPGKKNRPIPCFLTKARCPRGIFAAGPIAHLIEVTSLLKQDAKAA